MAEGRTRTTSHIASASLEEEALEAYVGDHDAYNNGGGARKWFTSH
jgi:hypothetical protein